MNVSGYGLDNRLNSTSLKKYFFDESHADNISLLIKKQAIYVICFYR